MLSEWLYYFALKLTLLLMWPSQKVDDTNALCIKGPRHHRWCCSGRRQKCFLDLVHMKCSWAHAIIFPTEGLFLVLQPEGLRPYSQRTVDPVVWSFSSYVDLLPCFKHIFFQGQHHFFFQHLTHCFVVFFQLNVWCKWFINHCILILFKSYTGGPTYSPLWY